MVIRPITVERRDLSTGVASSGAAERKSRPGFRCCGLVKETSRKFATFWKGAIILR